MQLFAGLWYSKATKNITSETVSKGVPKGKGLGRKLEMATNTLGLRLCSRLWCRNCIYCKG